jgi:hypothetical protein
VLIVSNYLTKSYLAQILSINFLKFFSKFSCELQDINIFSEKFYVNLNLQLNFFLKNLQTLNLNIV